MTNLMSFCDEMSSLMDEGRAADIAYLVFSKTFDTVTQKSLRQAVDVWAG